MPELLNSFPVSDLTLPEDTPDIVRILLSDSFFADIEIQLRVVEHVLLSLSRLADSLEIRRKMVRAAALDLPLLLL